MSEDLYRDRGQTITGDPLKDGPDLDNPEHLLLALNRLAREGVELPDELRAEHERLLNAKKVRRAHAFVRAELERLLAEEQEAAEQAERERTVTFPGVPADDTDVLVIGNELNRYPGGEATDQEIDGLLYRFRPHALLHFVPADVALAWPHRRGLPGRKFAPWPKDLLRVFRNDFTRVKTGGLQGVRNPNYSDVEVDEEHLLAASVRVAKACKYEPLLEMWLATAEAGDDGLSMQLTAALSVRLHELRTQAA